MKKIIKKNPDHPQAIALRKFLIIMGVCHTVVCDREQNGSNEILYQSSSPDELALVTSAKDIGYELVARSSEEVTIYNSILGKPFSNFHQKIRYFPSKFLIKFYYNFGHFHILL